MHLSVLLNIPPLFSIAEINASLPMDEDITAPRQFTSNFHNFRVVLQDLLSTGILRQTLGSFALSIIAHTLYRYDTHSHMYGLVSFLQVLDYAQMLPLRKLSSADPLRKPLFPTSWRSILI